VPDVGNRLAFATLTNCGDNNGLAIASRRYHAILRPEAGPKSCMSLL